MYKLSTEKMEFFEKSARKPLISVLYFVVWVVTGREQRSGVLPRKGKKGGF